MSRVEWILFNNSSMFLLPLRVVLFLSLVGKLGGAEFLSLLFIFLIYLFHLLLDMGIIFVVFTMVTRKHSLENWIDF